MLKGTTPLQISNLETLQHATTVIAYAVGGPDPQISRLGGPSRSRHLPSFEGSGTPCGQKAGAAQRSATSRVPKALPNADHLLSLVIRQFRGTGLKEEGSYCSSEDRRQALGWTIERNDSGDRETGLNADLRFPRKRSQS